MKLTKTLLFMIAGAVSAALCGAPAGAEGAHYDTVILDGLVVDGTGNPGIYTDIAISGDTIARIGPLRAALADGLVEAAAIIEARGHVVAPGFIDVHTHADSSLLDNRQATNFIRDGVTSIVTGNCGGSRLPISVFLDDLETTGVALNTSTLVGHNTVRRNVIGIIDAEPDAEQLAEMEALVDQAMRDGAVGLSTGLIYRPGTYTKTDEILALAKVAAKHGGVYVTHMRSENEGIFAALDEALLIGREAKMPVQISHFKVSKKARYRDESYATINELLGTQFEAGDFVPKASRATLARVMKARAEGQDVTIDQYPYTASSTGLSVLLPDWVLAEGGDASKEKLADPETRARVVAEMAALLRDRQMENYAYAQLASCRSDKSLNGMTIHDVAVQRYEEPTIEQEAETIIDLHVAGGASMVYHKMAEDDVVRIMQNPHVMVCSDSSVRVFGSGVPHPRGYGTNARVLGRYVRELGALSLEDAVRKMTSLPAQRFAFRERGLLREGMKADIVVFDPATVTDHATFTEPHQYSTGFRAVLVNGEAVVVEDEATDALPGQILRGQGFWREPETFAQPAPSVEIALTGE